MRRPQHYRSARGSLEANMTPMIDVIFNLLIFFVCTVSFQAPEEILPTSLSLAGSGADVPLPKEIAELEEIVVKVFLRDGQVAWDLNDRTFTQLGALRDVLLAIAQLQADLPLVIDVQDEVPLGHVIDLYDICRLAGFQKVQFAADVGQQ